MNILAEDMKIGAHAHSALRAQRDAALRRRTIGGLDRLDDRLLKDVGLFREHLPSGATSVRRR